MISFILAFLFVVSIGSIVTSVIELLAGWFQPDWYSRWSVAITDFVMNMPTPTSLTASGILRHGFKTFFGVLNCHLIPRLLSMVSLSFLFAGIAVGLFGRVNLPLWQVWSVIIFGLSFAAITGYVNLRRFSSQFK